MGFLALLILFFAVSRFLRMREWQRGFAYGCYPRRHYHRLHYSHAAPAPQPRETAFETLKRRYVTGELSDEQYESHLDALLKTPEGRRELQ